MIMKYFTRHTTTDIRGFTLVETLVSVFILTVIIIGPLTVASSASAYARLTKDTMIAAYLAQEAIELLRHHQDSIYIRCADQETSSCLPVNGERPNETAWRIFKERLGGNVQGASCLVSDNPSGCAYDFIDMTADEDSHPPKYASTDPSCNTLSFDPASYVYVCTGVHGAGFRQTNFSRKVQITSVPSFSGADQEYNDDLRVTVTITFKRINGYTHQVKVVDFLHARA